MKKNPSFFPNWGNKIKLRFIVIVDSNVGLFSDSWSIWRDCVVFSPIIRASILRLIVIAKENKVHGGIVFPGIEVIVSEEVLLLRSNMGNSVNV